MAKIELPYWANQIVENPYPEKIDRFVITGGLGSAKTTMGLLAFFMHILRNKNTSMWWVVGPTHSRIDDAVIPAAIFALNLLGFVPNVHYVLKKSKPSTINLYTNQEIRFLSADKPQYFVSASIGGYYLTAEMQAKREVYENLEARTRAKSAKHTVGIIEGTPEGDRWTKDEFDFDKVDLNRKMRRFIVETYDNEHNLSPGYIDRLFSIYAGNPAKIESYIFGRFASFRSGDVYNFVESRNVIDDITADAYRPISICWDFNANPVTWSAWQFVPYQIGNARKYREICIDESSLNCHNLNDACLEIAKAFPPSRYANTEMQIWGDRSGHSTSHKAPGSDYSNILNILTEVYDNVSIKATRKVTPVRASIEVLNRLFLYELVLICQRCKNVRRSLNNTKWAQGKDDIEKKAGETHTHHADGLKYRIYDLYKNANIDNLLENLITKGTNY